MNEKIRLHSDFMIPELQRMSLIFIYSSTKTMYSVCILAYLFEIYFILNEWINTTVHDT